jgi:DMSO/TMAO reductase YedYZ heme-binding membrane subunit
MKSLLGNIRFYILVFSVSFSLAIYLWISATIPPGSLQTIRLTELYAFTAVTFLYLALLAGPLCYTFRQLPFRAQYLKARRAIGVSAFYFSFIHFLFAFFGQLGGFPGLWFLNGTYFLAISLSFTALIILFLMAITSFDAVIAKITFSRWKLLHRFVYLAGFLILIHVLMLGSHFQNLFGAIPQIFFAALAILLLLEANRFDAFLQKKIASLPRFGISITILLALIITATFYEFIPTSTNGTPLSLNIHAQHIQLAKQAQQVNNTQLPSSVTNIPGLKGDRNKRFTVSFLHEDAISANTDTTLTFQVFDASSGNRVNFFNTVYEKTMHLIVVDSQLKYFNHIHPKLTDNGFTITTQFPKDGIYHLYVDFQPFGAIEQQMAFTVKVGNVDKPVFSKAQPDTNLTKSFGQYDVIFDFAKPIRAADMSIGQQQLSFTIKDAKTKQPVKTLKPYLAAYGHLVMINQETFDYLHVHPTNITPPAPNSDGGPTVDFIPLGLYGPIKPGIYRVFAQFNPDGKLMVADYTVKVE